MFLFMIKGDEKALTTAVAFSGPVAVGISVSPSNEDLRFFKEGMFPCLSSRL